MHDKFILVLGWFTGKWCGAPWWGKCIYAGITVWLFALLLCSIFFTCAYFSNSDAEYNFEDEE